MAIESKLESNGLPHWFQIHHKFRQVIYGLKVMKKVAPNIDLLRTLMLAEESLVKYENFLSALSEEEKKKY